MSLLSKTFQLSNNLNYHNRVMASMFKQAWIVGNAVSSGNLSIDLKRSELLQEVFFNERNARDFITQNLISLTVGHPQVQGIISANPETEDYNSLIEDEIINTVTRDSLDILAGININNPEL